MVPGKSLVAFKSGVKKIRPEDRELSQIQDNLGNALQGVLDHLLAQEGPGKQAQFSPALYQPNPNVQSLAVQIPALQIFGRSDGAFQVNQPTILFGNPASKSPSGGSNPQLDSSLFSYGQIVAVGSQSATDGFIIIPQVSGPAFRVAPNNAPNAFQVNFDGSAGCSGPFNAASLKSDAGIKTWLNGMFYWNPSYQGGLVPLVVAIANGATAGTTPWAQPMTRSGSLVGVSAYQTAQTNITCSVFVYKNGAQVYGVNFAAGASAFAVITKGAIPFVAGDVLTAKIGYGLTNTNLCTQVALEVEEVA